MATISGGEKLQAALAEMAARLAKPATLRVGFLENARYPNGTSVALVAAVQNYGAPRANIPPRPFFSNMVRSKSSGWPKAIALNLKAQNYDATKALVNVGEGIAGQLRQSIKDTNRPALRPATIARKGFSKPLVDTGVMLGSVDYEIKD